MGIQGKGASQRERAIELVPGKEECSSQKGQKYTFLQQDPWSQKERARRKASLSKSEIQTSGEGGSCKKASKKGLWSASEKIDGKKTSLKRNTEKMATSRSRREGPLAESLFP